MQIGVVLPTVINSPHVTKKKAIVDYGGIDAEDHCQTFASPKKDIEHYVNKLRVNDLDVDQSLEEYDRLLGAKGANFEGKIIAERPRRFGMVVGCGQSPTSVVEPKKMSHRVIYLKDNNNCKWVEEPCFELMCP